ncbi:hypothetical protein pb186bvf_012502 [Paramecium bursaria]
MEQENSNCKQLILQSDLPQDQKNKYVGLLDRQGREQIHQNQISKIEYTTLKEKLAILNKFNKFRTFDKTFSAFEITSIKDKQNNQDLVIVIQLDQFNGIDAIEQYKMKLKESSQNQINSIKQQFNKLFSSYIEFRDQFKNDELKNLCIHKILSLTLGELRISVLDKECYQCSQQSIKSIQIQLIEQIANAFNEIKKKEYEQEQQANQESEQWKIDELKQQIQLFKNNNNKDLLYEEYVKSEIIPQEIPKLQDFFCEIRNKLFNQSPFGLEDRANEQKQFQEDEMQKIRNKILSNNFAIGINIEVYNKQFLIYLLIIQKILLKNQTDEQREKELLLCLKPYLQSTNYKDGLYNFWKSFHDNIAVLDQIIKKLDELQ